MTDRSEVSADATREIDEEDFTASGELTPALYVLCALCWAVLLPCALLCALLERVGLKRRNDGMRDFCEIKEADPGPRTRT
jgi:hypothetical protein